MVTMETEKTWFLFFKPKNSFSTHLFYQKHLENTIGTLLNQSMSSTNTKNHPKTHNHLEIKKIFLSSNLFFQAISGKKKKHNLNSSSYKTSFHKNQLFQQRKSSLTKTFSLYIGIQPPSFSSTKNGLQKRKIKFGIKIRFLKMRGINYVISKKDGDQNELFK